MCPGTCPSAPVSPTSSRAHPGPPPSLPPGPSTFLAPSRELGVPRPPLPSPHPFRLLCPQLLSAPLPWLPLLRCAPAPGCWSELWPPFRVAPLLLLNDSVSLSRMLRVLPKHRSPSSYITVLLRLLFNNSSKIYAFGCGGCLLFCQGFLQLQRAGAFIVVCGLLIASLFVEQGLRELTGPLA